MPGAVWSKLTGICGPARGAVLAECIRNRPARVWLAIIDDLRTAERLAEDVLFFLRAADPATTSQALLFPESIADSPDMREAFAASSDRLTVLSRLRGFPAGGSARGPGNTLVIVTTPAALLQPVPAVESFARREIKLAVGQHQPFADLLVQLRDLDYDSEAVCEAPGHYAVRGGIIDIYPVTATQPYRLDFFGDEIEDIRTMDPVTQRSLEKVAAIAITASPGVALDSSSAGLADYLPQGSHLALLEPSVLETQFGALSGSGEEGLPPLLKRCSAAVAISELDEATELVPPGSEATAWITEGLATYRRSAPEGLIAQEQLQFENDARREFLRQVDAWKEAGDSIAFVAAGDGEEKHLREILVETGGIAGRRPKFLRGNIDAGFRLEHTAGTGLSLAGPARGLVVVTETEIFGRLRARRRTGSGRVVGRRAQVDQLLDFAELAEGDYVVHLQHGVAHYRGVGKIETAEGLKEVISLEFDDGVTLHVPLSESHLVSRYVGLGKAKPQLGRIGTGRWEKTRRAAERATLDLAAELLQIQAKREAQPGFAFPADSAWQQEFEASFPFKETPDQLRAINETKSDMERRRPMDRLICGDVGFGKTEVALRAAFKATQGGRQVAVLAPTTVLVQQHLNTFRERTAGYPIVVEMLSRFRTRAEQERILEATAAGRVDILIGTHRLLQPDLRFRELGLVIIDEEQRFGVKHKEVFKRMRETVDVLSMSATPIPRTLYLALTGARDLSVIETPPADRHPIQTVVTTYDEKIIVDAIRHEIRRGGQVFYLHNRVATIDLATARLRALLPELEIGVGHGKMDAVDLEKVMTDFVAGRYQVLVCTTIIESGLDIQNCNTIVIEGADRFGLAQLYQLRGRVGRGRNQAYAYLLLHHHTRVLDAARHRLAALRQHTQPGSGFRIAMRDLELRGSGNLLGSEQSGHIAGVGFELYCQLLRQSVARLKGDRKAAAVRASVKLDFVFIGEASVGSPGTDPGRLEDGYTAIKDAENAADAAPLRPIQARLPPAYIAETRLRIDFYRRLALASSVAELRQIAADLRDRFGRLGEEVRALLLVTEIRVHAEQKGLLSVETESSRLKCLRNSGRHDDWIMSGSRFPRLTATRPLLRLREVLVFLNNLPNS
jgi:transcription-repair coupling factor (superfamily II helicase)